MVNVDHSEVMYKTAMCRTFASSGSCPYGYKCLFAHGPEELRSVSDNESLQVSGASPREVPNYRTSMFRSASAINSLPMSRGFSLSSSAAASAAQRHNSVINQSLVAQSARRSRAFFPSDAAAATTNHMLLAKAATAAAAASPASPARSGVYTPQQRLSNLTTFSSVSPATAGLSSSLSGASPSAASGLNLGTPLHITSASPRKWSASSPAMSTQELAGSSGVPAAARTPQAMERAKKLYKTELCRSWQEYRMCPYGLKCQFAHGEQELRQVERHRKYKTERCRKFHAEGVCPFGSRCIFIHDEDERELPNSPTFDPVFAAQMRQRRSSGPVRHLTPSMNMIDVMSPLGMSPLGMSPMNRLQSYMSPAASPMRLSPYSKRFTDDNASVDDFIKRRMTDASMDERVNSLRKGVAGMSVKDGQANASRSEESGSGATTSSGASKEKAAAVPNACGDCSQVTAATA